MANSVIFSNGHPSERSHGFVGVGQKHLDKDKDFDLMVGLMVLVNNAEININSYNAAIVTTVSQTNQMIDSDIGFIDNSQKVQIVVVLTLVVLKIQQILILVLALILILKKRRTLFHNQNVNKR